MHRLAFLLILAMMAAPLEVSADALTRSVQGQLKERGFYYGNVDGVSGPETTAAVRRFQIRNGLKVTGTLTEETLASLRTSPSAPAATANTITQTPPATDFRERDRAFLGLDDGGARAQEPPRSRDYDEDERDEYRRPSRDYLPPPASLPPDDAVRAYRQVLRNTPFEDGPIELQEDVVRDAQTLLARLRYYRDTIDGLPGPATERAIVVFQNNNHLRRTGRLDVPTLERLGLLSPRRYGSSRFEIEIRPRGGSRIYRGYRVR